MPRSDQFCVGLTLSLASRYLVTSIAHLRRFPATPPLFGLSSFPCWSWPAFGCGWRRHRRNPSWCHLELSWFYSASSVLFRSHRLRSLAHWVRFLFLPSLCFAFASLPALFASAWALVAIASASRRRTRRHESGRESRRRWRADAAVSHWHDTPFSHRLTIRADTL